MKRLIKIPFLTLLLVSPVVFPQEKEKPVVEVSSDNLGNVQDEFQEHFFEALKQKAIENYDKAISELSQCLAFEQHPAVYLELGKNYNLLNKHSQAAVYLEKARAAAPQNQAVLEELYQSYFLSREYDKAISVVEDLAAIKSSFSDDLANLYTITEKYDLALALLDSLDRKQGNSTFREGLRRQIFAKTKNVEAQITDLQKSISNDPQEEKDYLNLIFVYSENGRTEEAFATAKELLEKNPDSELVHLALYKFYMNEKDSENAVRSMKILLGSSQIDEVTKYQALNDFLMYVSENPALERDLVDLVNVFSVNESNNKVFGQLGTFFLEKGNKQLALDYFGKALENNPDDFSLFREVIKLHLELSNFAEAEKLSSRALEIYPTQAWLYLLKGTSQNQLGNFKGAEAALKDGLDFIIEDQQMEKEFYNQLSAAYKGLNLPKKEAEFRLKAEQIIKNNG